MNAGGFRVTGTRVPRVHEAPIVTLKREEVKIEHLTVPPNTVKTGPR